MAEVPKTAVKQSMLQIYKRSQGYYTRMGTAVGSGILLAGLFHFIWENLSFNQDSAAGMWLKIGIPLAVSLVIAVVLYWLIGVNRSSCDFMIATEGEMKKVNWTTKKEIVAATKVVILVTALAASFFFVVDVCFMWFFRYINVLHPGVAAS